MNAQKQIMPTSGNTELVLVKQGDDFGEWQADGELKWVEIKATPVPVRQEPEFETIEAVPVETSNDAASGALLLAATGGGIATVGYLIYLFWMYLLAAAGILFLGWAACKAAPYFVRWWQEEGRIERIRRENDYPMPRTPPHSVNLPQTTGNGNIIIIQHHHHYYQ